MSNTQMDALRQGLLNQLKEEAVKNGLLTNIIEMVEKLDPIYSHNDGLYELEIQLIGLTHEKKMALDEALMVFVRSFDLNEPYTSKIDEVGNTLSIQYNGLDHDELGMISKIAGVPYKNNVRVERMSFDITDNFSKKYYNFKEPKIKFIYEQGGLFPLTGNEYCNQVNRNLSETLNLEIKGNIFDKISYLFNKKGSVIDLEASKFGKSPFLHQKGQEVSIWHMKKLIDSMCEEYNANAGNMDLNITADAAFYLSRPVALDSKMELNKVIIVPDLVLMSYHAK